MKKWFGLLLALVMIFTAVMAAFAEEDEEGDDSVQIPVDAPDEEGEGTVEQTELRILQTGDEGDDVLFLQMRLKSLQYFDGETDGKNVGKDGL